MSEVNVSLNGKNFKDFEVRISEYNNLVGLLERKDITQYNWAEYHGISPNLKRPKFKERTIELKCFIRGENWEEMFDNFMKFIIAEFSKSGTQRLHITPFNYRTIPYEVYIKDEVKPEKTFSDGVMFGVFSLKLIEPNPIKKILKTSLDKFKLSYKIDSETEIFFGDGTRQVGRGNVSLTKDYAFPSYQSSGISLVQRSVYNDDFYEFYTQPVSTEIYLLSLDVTLLTDKDVIVYVVGRKPDNTYVLATKSDTIQAVSGLNTLSFIKELNITEYGKFIFKVLDTDGNEIPGLIYSNPKIETAEVLGEWQDMQGKEKIIIIAGNIEEIEEFSSEASTIWDKI